MKGRRVGRKEVLRRRKKGRSDCGRMEEWAEGRNKWRMETR